MSQPQAKPRPKTRSHLTTGELAQLTGKPQRTIEAWLEAGRLGNCDRTPGGHARIPAEVVEKIEDGSLPLAPPPGEKRGPKANPPEETKRLFDQGQALIQQLAREAFEKATPAQRERGYPAFLSAATAGLLGAVDSYRPDKHGDFEAYASERIQAAIRREAIGGLEKGRLRGESSVGGTGEMAKMEAARLGRAFGRTPKRESSKD
jgi:excisionase family DNA binding protein